ncbi:PREDICTED: nucleolar GTP-binding protein 1-like [Camelina sativa]|uniref:Nucleolar GTP-binding protein 1-like n=1 Tax=Camelina sativa TaxID=90675 RepID=A0ABM0T0D7_CAMSA|nr:PREDICTED: nucleolar GTP-binding protein 1-like [Camelina sativa]
MVQYDDFKNIKVVPIGNEFVDVTLLHVHRQTPKVLLKDFNINHHRQFYTRKVKKTELTFCQKLSTIIDEFPSFDEINPFYIDLLRSSFDRDEYELSLGQVNTAKHMITNISIDYVTQLEFVESLKQCKALKASAVGQMFDVINEITPALAYLEQIRQRMARLPSVDLSTPTLVVCGYPDNVDKACFMNGVNINTGASDHDYTTTKSVNVVVGHTEYKDLMYQVIDAPGVLNTPTFGDSTVIATLARHLSSALVLFFMDVSGSCGYSIPHQAALLHSLKSLFLNKPLVAVCDETDLMQVSEQDLELIEEITSGMGDYEEEEVGLKISNLTTEEGVMFVKNAACEMLLDGKESLSRTAQDNAEGLRNKYILASQERKDDIIPQPQTDLDDGHNVSDDLLVDSDWSSKLAELESEEGIKNAHDDEKDDFEKAKEHVSEEHKDKYILAGQESKDDIIPQPQTDLDDGRNVSDLLVDPDVSSRLAELEPEEGIKKAHEDEKDDFVMAKEHFREEHKDVQLVAYGNGKIQPLWGILMESSFKNVSQL